MSEEVALVAEPIASPAAVERGELALPRLVVDAGPAAVGKFLEFFAGADREPADAGGVRAGGGAGVDPAGRRLTGRALSRRLVLAMIDQAAGGSRRTGGVDLLPHVPGDRDHGVSVERWDAQARAADCRARVAEDDKALRPDGRCDQRRRDRTDRDLKETRDGR